MTRDRKIVENHGVPEYASVADLPDASTYTGMAFVQDTKSLYKSDGISWSSPGKFSSNSIAYIGDSRAKYGNRPYWKSAVIHSNGSYQNLPLTLSGTGPALTADDVTGATCKLEYRASDRKLRWTAPGDTAGDWTLPDPLTTLQTIQSGTTGKWLRYHVHNNTAWPATDVTLSVDVSGNMYFGKEARGFNTFITAALKIPASKVLHLGVGGQTTTGLYRSIAQHKAETTGPGIDVIRIGTNDISNMTTSPLATTGLAAMKTNVEAYVRARWGQGRFVILLGETARLKSGSIASSPVAIDSWQLAALIDYNQWLADLARDNADRCRYVDLYELTVDASYTDGRPIARALIDTVHDSVQGAIDVANKVNTVINSLTNKFKSYPVGKLGNGMGTNASLNATSAAGLGTGASGVTPTTITGTLAQAAGTCTVVGAAEARGEGYSANWFKMTCAATADNSVIQWRSVSRSLANLGKSVGDTVTMSVELDVVNSNLVDYVNAFALFTGAAVTMGIHLLNKETITPLDESSASFSGIFSCDPCVIPSGTTAMVAYLYIGLKNGGSTVVKACNICLE